VEYVFGDEGVASPAVLFDVGPNSLITIVGWDGDV
jgi:hypothetical protein